VQGSEEIGPVYRLIDVQTGKSYKSLVPADRLKMFTADRTDLCARLPSNLDVVERDTEIESEKEDDELSGCHPAKRILKQRVRNRKTEHLVLFQDNSKAWCDFVTPALLQHFRLAQERRRQRRRKKRGKN